MSALPAPPLQSHDPQTPADVETGPPTVAGFVIAPATPYHLDPVEPGVYSFRVIGPDGERDDAVVFASARRPDANNALALLTIGYRAGTQALSEQDRRALAKRKLQVAARRAMAEIDGIARGLDLTLEHEQTLAKCLRMVRGNLEAAL